MMGAFGDIVFSSSDKKILTFYDFARNSGGRWSDHNRHLLKPLTEFLGPNLDDINFNITLSINHGINPRTTLNQFLDYERSGIAATLVIGPLPVGVYKWTLRQFTQNWERFDGKGNLIYATANLSLKEYAER